MSDITTTGASAAGASRIGGTRFFMLGLVCLAVLVNYLDRAIIGIAAPSIRSEMHIDAAMMGFVFSAFSWSYFAAQIPLGAMLDRFGNRIIYFLALAFWSLFTLGQAFASSVGGFIGLRVGLGLAEAPCFPANSNIVGMWFPRKERARAIGIYTAAEYVGLGFLTPGLFWLLQSFGWPSLFIVTGIAGLIIAAIWIAKYRDPHESKSVSQAELQHIAAGGGLTGKGVSGQKFKWADVAELFRHRQIWGLLIGQFSVYSTFIFFLTWFPTYLATARHMGWIKVGFFASLPYIAGFFGILFAGWLSDKLLHRGVSLGVARKLPVIMGLLGASTIIACNYVKSDNMVIAILSFAFFCQAMSSSGWSVLSEISPLGKLGLVGGLFNAAANLSGIVIPIVIGFIVQDTGSFVGALIFVGGVALVGALSWIFGIGELKPITLRHSA
ncbi:MFS transporter [Acidocella aminolytica]|jgi:ACS family D-galactonate transporter-like MFS transporter|uniref:Major facilitator superfamily glucarate/galactonate transporter n=1 Tax=Acidocella aminolytica 101 = DSM 11237 TaxID=1120923 RepID=A0A0D6PGR2_9PROT|nr:MFS transporter [Acidocella aminolytica]GAN80566.1 major facilitator superfamily glucarate/galactonate transporter [Acidocella aminolytica 101 = DSM 11237]GBQ43065.1 major facilitator superfamily transporter [Acidocella aminolytica 101 = DSM 11237]SHE28807.1 MFS transporter, ACS family, D-galactonate transporter [Acidocella aminolytica 101 = DSM 11237]